MDAMSELIELAGTSPINVLHVGLGPIGQAAAKLASQRSSLRLMAAVDVAPALQGRQLGELIGLDPHKSVVIGPDIPDVTAERGFHVALHATSSSLERCADQLIGLASAGWNVVSSCEELFYPWLANPELAKLLDEVAAEAGVSIVGTGVNPGYAMDYLPLALTSTMRNVHRVSVLRVQDAGRRRLPLQKKVGAGLNQEEFATRAAAKTIRHVGLLESVQALANALGFADVEYEDTIAPIIADVPTPSGMGLIAPGSVLGVHQIASACHQGDELIKLELRMAVGLPEPRDEVKISGDPDIQMVIPGGFSGDTATEAMLVNTVLPALTARSGLRVMAELPPPRPFA